MTSPSNPEDRIDGRIGWIYLGVLALVFGAVAAWAFSSGDDDLVTATPRSTTTLAVDTEAPVGEVVEILLVVDGPAVTLQGAVPDTDTRDLVRDLAVARYGEDAVIDELQVQPTRVLEGGAVSVTGITDVGDDEPQGLQADIAAVLRLVAGDVDLELNQVVVPPADIRIGLDRDAITFAGEVPDQAAFDALVQPAVVQWGDGRVDSSGLSIGMTTLEDATVTIEGTIDAGDIRVQDYEASLGAAFPTVVVDRTTLAVDTSAEALGRLEGRLRELVAANPILFELGSAEISPESDETLQRVAAAIAATPGIQVQVVGHTDDQGPESINQQLSEERAGAVQSRLITLGIPPDQFLLPRGAGESEPIADNSTEEGQAQNRRIAFEFEGAVDAPADDADADEG